MKKVFWISIFTALFITTRINTNVSALSATQVSPTPNPTPGPTLTPYPDQSEHIQRLLNEESQLTDARLDIIETELDEMQIRRSGSQDVFFDFLKSLLQSGWLIFAIILVGWFHKEISEILRIVPNRLKEARVEWGDKKISVSIIDSIVLEREILKTMIAIATIDNDPDPSELAHIATVSKGMNSQLDVLQEDDKKQIIMAAINLAIADGDFRSEEYAAIRIKAEHYKISEMQLSNMIREACLTAGIALPN